MAKKAASNKPTKAKPTTWKEPWPSAVARDIQAGGAAPLKYISTGTTQDATVLKAAQCLLYGLQLYNNAAYPVFVKLYDKATAPTAADTPVMAHEVPANSPNGGGAVVGFPVGARFSAGLSLRITKGGADNDNVAVAAGDAIVNYQTV